MGYKVIRLRKTPLLKKQAGQIKKLFGLWDDKPKSKKCREPSINYEPEVKHGIPNFLYHTKGLNQTFVTRRQIVLNRHFTEILSDVLALKFQSQLAQYGINITSIETKAWNKGVDIFYCTPEPFNMETHKNVNSLIPELRKSIVERRLIGRVPPIHFVYDQTIETDRRLSKALEKINLTDIPETKLVPGASNSLGSASDRKPDVDYNRYLKPRDFSAPHDMTNDILGLDYPSLYNKVVTNLERGRGESSRMIPASSLASAEPLFTKPIFAETEVEELDPVVRIRNMQKFLVEQKKKYTVQSRYRRKQELLLRDKYKWDAADEEEQTQGKQTHEEPFYEEEQTEEEYSSQDNANQQ